MMKVKEIKDTSVMAEMLNTGKLGERKNMNLPGIIVNLPTVTEKDKDDLLNFGAAHGVDFVAASFVRKPLATLSTTLHPLWNTLVTSLLHLDGDWMAPSRVPHPVPQRGGLIVSEVRLSLRACSKDSYSNTNCHLSEVRLSL